MATLARRDAVGAEWRCFVRSIYSPHVVRTPSRMSRVVVVAGLSALLVAGLCPGALAQRATVCSITVNSEDEREAFRRHLPADRYEFVELVERGRPDWLATACRQGVRCDVLVISGHYDGGNEFFSDRLEASEYLPVDEMERVSCSDSCPGLFSQLKEVYLFGCNTLNAEPLRSASGEIGRSLVRAGHSEAEAARLSRALGARHGESSRDRMRQVFPGVPVIYGFSSTAPVGPTAAALLDRYFQGGGGASVASGRASGRLIEQFRAHAMVSVRGVRASDAGAAHRQDVCRFADDRLSNAQRLAFVHELLGRDMAEVRMFLDRIEEQVASLDEAERMAPATAAALGAIARDREARERFLAFARDADQPAVRARMLALSRELGWLTREEERAELMALIGERLEWGPVGPGEVDLVCALNQDRALDPERRRLTRAQGVADPAAHAAILACLGSAEGHARTLRGLTGPDEDARISQVYLRHRPIADVNELRAVTSEVALMRNPAGQIRALDTLAGHRLSDPVSIEALVRLFQGTDSAGVQAAIAGVLIRSEIDESRKVDIEMTLRRHRLASGGGEGLVDVLIRRLHP